MNRHEPESEIPPVAGLGFPGGDVSWVGESTWADGLVCLGSDDGRIRLAKLDGSGTTVPDLVSKAGEAINGVAFSQVDRSFVAISTRNEVAFLDIPPIDSGAKHATAVYPGGAHGVVSTPGGHFVAPTGPGGLLVAMPRQGDGVEMRTIQTRDMTLNVYQALALGSDSTGRDVIALALRKRGFGFVTLDANGRSAGVGIAPLGGTDVVALGSLGEASMPLGVVAAGRDGSIHLLQVSERDARPISVRFDNLNGVIYQILGFQGHLFVMTSRATYVMHDVASRYVRGESIVSKPIPIGRIDLVAVDASVVHGRLLVVTADGVIDLTKDVASSGESDPAVSSLARNKAGLTSNNPAPLSHSNDPMSIRSESAPIEESETNMYSNGDETDGLTNNYFSGLQALI